MSWRDENLNLLQQINACGIIGLKYVYKRNLGFIAIEEGESLIKKPYKYTLFDGDGVLQ